MHCECLLFDVDLEQSCLSDGSSSQHCDVCCVQVAGMMGPAVCLFAAAAPCSAHSPYIAAGLITGHGLVGSDLPVSAVLHSAHVPNHCVRLWTLGLVLDFAGIVMQLCIWFWDIRQVLQQ